MGGTGQTRGELGIAVFIPLVGRATLAETVLALLSDDAIAEIVVVSDRAVSQMMTVQFERIPAFSAAGEPRVAGEDEDVRLDVAVRVTDPLLHTR